MLLFYLNEHMDKATGSNLMGHPTFFFFAKFGNSLYKIVLFFKLNKLIEPLC